MYFRWKLISTFSSIFAFLSLAYIINYSHCLLVSSARKTASKGWISNDIAFITFTAWIYWCQSSLMRCKKSARFDSLLTFEETILLCPDGSLCTDWLVPAGISCVVVLSCDVFFRNSDISTCSRKSRCSSHQLLEQQKLICCKSVVFCKQKQVALVNWSLPVTVSFCRLTCLLFLRIITRLWHLKK